MFCRFYFSVYLKIILVVCRKNFRITLKELVNNFLESLEDGQASLLVVTYCISSVRSMYSMKCQRLQRVYNYFIECDSCL